MRVSPHNPIGEGLPCHWCKRRMRSDTADLGLRPTRDHVVPRSRMEPGRNPKRNLVWACHACNNLKGGMDIGAWYALMNQVPEWWAFGTKGIGPRGNDLHLAMIEDGFSMPRFTFPATRVQR